MDTRARFRLSILFAHILHLMLQALLLGLDQSLWVSDILALVQILMPSSEGLHHVSALIRTASLIDKFRIFALSALL